MPSRKFSFFENLGELISKFETDSSSISTFNVIQVAALENRRSGGDRDRISINLITS